MRDQRSERSRLPIEKIAYFRWRDTLNGYEDIDSNIEEDQQLRFDLRITSEDDLTWTRIKESEFRVEF